MLNNFKHYRKTVGGYWIKSYNWTKISKTTYNRYLDAKRNEAISVGWVREMEEY